MESFIAHVRSIGPDLASGLIAIDGKTVRHSFEDGDPSNRIHLITSTRETKGATSIEKCYYLISHAPDVEKLGDLVRRHCGIENQCNWIPDVTFDEDPCRARKGHAAQNLLRADQTIKDTMRGKRVRAALCEQILEILMKLRSPACGSPDREGEVH